MRDNKIFIVYERIHGQNWKKYDLKNAFHDEHIVQGGRGVR